jgi:uncharacterized membrane protein
VLFFKTELSKKIAKEFAYLAVIYFIAIVVMKIVFFKENFLVVIRIVSSFYWLFILPGFAFMYIWHDKIDFLERFIISVAVSAVIVSVPSYYISLLGLHAKYHIFLIPAACILISSAVVWRINRIKA